MTNPTLTPEQIQQMTEALRGLTPRTMAAAIAAQAPQRTPEAALLMLENIANRINDNEAWALQVATIRAPDGSLTIHATPQNP